MSTSPGAAAERPPEFADRDLRGARFVRSDLSGVVMRGVQVDDADVDAPWLLESGARFLVNGVDVAPYVDAELDRRFPGRALRRADDPAGLRAAWTAVEDAWAAAVARAEALPTGSVDVQVGGEWSFAQTVRHLVMATDTWVRGAVLRVPAPYHPVGQPHAEYASDGHDPSVFSATDPSWAEVREARADRQRVVRELLAGVTPADLTGVRSHPWAPEHDETVLTCVRTVLEEEWEHLRYALRDLDVVERGASG